MTRFDPFRLFVVVYAIAACFILWEMYHAERVLAEIRLDPIVVQMADPLPCLTDPLVRAACGRLGCECRGGAR